MNNILSYTDYLTESIKCPKEDMVNLDIDILDKDGNTHTGKLKVHKDIKDDIISIFKELKEIGYPVECMKLASEFDNDDDKSMEHNNTYSYCHRYIRYTKRLSPHSFGICIDLNPRYNPCVRFKDDGTIKSVFPVNGTEYADRKKESPYKITQDVVNIFKKYGFSWGGDWKDKKDYHHFERTDLRKKYLKRNEI